jgi:hypothetical protein
VSLTDDSRVIFYDRNMFIIQVTGLLGKMALSSILMLLVLTQMHREFGLSVGCHDIYQKDVHQNAIMTNDT